MVIDDPKDSERLQLPNKIRDLASRFEPSDSERPKSSNSVAKFTELAARQRAMIEDPH